MKSRILRIALILAVFGIPTFHGPLVLAQEAGPGEGLVIFSREDKFAGKAIRFDVTIDGGSGVQLLAGSTIRKALSVGTHTFAVYTPSLDGQDSITIDIQEGWTYHIEGYVLMGWPVGRAKFRLVSESGPTPGSSPAMSSTDVLAGAALGAATTAPGVAPARSAEESGRLGLRNFVGDWDLEMWSLARDGSRLEGRGSAQGVAEGDGTRITITEFSATAFPAAEGGGQVRLAYEDGKGFTLESWFKHSNEVFRFSGRYQPDTGRYVFYSFGSGGETATGMPRQSVRVEVRAVDIATWAAETYSSIEGQSLLVQSYRFTRKNK